MAKPNESSFIKQIVRMEIPPFKCETYYEGSKVRLRPCEGECVPPEMQISSSLTYRESFPVGSQFLCRDSYFQLMPNKTTIFIKARDVIILKVVRK